MPPRNKPSRSPTASVKIQVSGYSKPSSLGNKSAWVTPMTIPIKPSIEPMDKSIFRVTMTSTMPVAMMATDDDCTERFHRLRGVRNRPPESTSNATQISSSAPIMPSIRMSSSVALRNCTSLDRIMVESAINRRP